MTVLVIILIILYLYVDPYVDIQEDKVIFWYNWSGYRNFYVWNRQSF